MFTYNKYCPCPNLDVVGKRNLPFTVINFQMHLFEKQIEFNCRKRKNLQVGETHPAKMET